MNIKEKIAALLAKAKSTDNEHEAAAFIAKAEELLIAHQLELGDVLGSDDPVQHVKGLTMAASGHKWTRELYRALALYFGAKTCLETHWVRDPKTGEPIKQFVTAIVGRESAIATVEAMYPWVAAEVRRHGKDIAESTGMSAQGQAKRVGAALVLRIWALIHARSAHNADEPATAVARNALVTIDQVQALFDEVYPETGTRVARRMTSDRMSREAANSIGLSQQVGGAGALRIGGR